MPEDQTLSRKLVTVQVPDSGAKRMAKEKAIHLARRFARKKRPCPALDFQSVPDPVPVYWPYWTGRIETTKKRPLFRPRRITYYAVFDAVAGGHSLVRSIPEMTPCRVPADGLIEAVQDREAAGLEFLTVQKEKIPKLFIFGPPEQKLEKIEMIYCQHWKVVLTGKGVPGSKGTFYVNAFNGAVRDL